MQSPGKWHTFQGGLKDGGEISLSCHFDKTAFAAHLALVGSSKGWRITFSDGSKLGISGYIKGFGSKTPLDDIVAVDIKIKVSGSPTFVAAP